MGLCRRLFQGRPADDTEPGGADEPHGEMGAPAEQPGAHLQEVEVWAPGAGVKC